MNGKSTAKQIVSQEAPPKSLTIETRVVLAVGICILVAAICLVAFRHIFLHSSTWPQGWVNPFDAAIVRYVNRFANRWPWLCPALLYLDDHNILKGGPIVLLMWVAFFQKTRSAAKALERRRKIAAIVPLAIFGVCLARMLAVALPFRERPIRTIALHFQLPAGLKPSFLYGWSSFPSDHAVLFVTLCIGLLMASRPLGSIALAYTSIVILLPRIFLGLHWPTDILAGMAIGITLASIVAIPRYRNFIWRLAMKCWEGWPGLFAAFVFLVSYEIIDLFGTLLTIAKWILHHH